MEPKERCSPYGYWRQRITRRDRHIPVTLSPNDDDDEKACRTSVTITVFLFSIPIDYVHQNSFLQTKNLAFRSPMVSRDLQEHPHIPLKFDTSPTSAPSSRSLTRAVQICHIQDHPPSRSRRQGRVPCPLLILNAWHTHVARLQIARTNTCVHVLRKKMRWF